MTTSKQIDVKTTVLQRVEQRVYADLEQNFNTELAVIKQKEVAKKLKNAQKIVPSFELSEKDKTALFLAIIFTPTNYSNTIEKPLSHNQTIAKDYLKEEKISEDVTQKVIACLQIVNGEKETKTLLEEVYEDIQNSIFAEKKYIQKSLPFRQQEENIDPLNPIEVQLWLKNHYAQLKSIDFNTKAAKKKYKAGIKGNLKALKKLRTKKKKKIAVYEMPLDNSKGV